MVSHHEKTKFGRKLHIILRGKCPIQILNFFQKSADFSKSKFSSRKSELLTNFKTHDAEVDHLSAQVNSF